MARKNPFASVMQDITGEPASQVLDYTLKGASRSIINSIDELAQRADKLLEGQTIVDLDAADLDVSFVSDRMEEQGADYLELLEAIREQGQASPVLVRPHPTKTGCYMIVFGHRRVLAAAALGRPVRAVVRAMDDRDHVIAQGQENSARSNLSFIEKAVFAQSLVHLGYDNATVLAALSVDRATLSKMLSVASISSDIRNAIGPAKAVGRDRWYELKTMLEKPAMQEAALAAIKAGLIPDLGGEKAFEGLLDFLKNRRRKSKTAAAEESRKWIAQDSQVSAEIKSRGRNYMLALKAKGKEAAGFGAFITDNLPALYEAYRQKSNTNEGD